MRFQTLQSTLERYPDSLLGNLMKRQSYYIPKSDEYFFDRHRTCFESILYIYQVRTFPLTSSTQRFQSYGRIKRPETVPIDIFLAELRFFQMGPDVTEKFWASEGYQKPVEPAMPKNE